MWKLLGYRLATKNLPRIHTPNLVFQGGQQQVSTTDSLGGGNIVPKTFSGRFRPVVMSRAIVNLGIQGNHIVRPFGVAPLANSPDIVGYNPTTGASTSTNF